MASMDEYIDQMFAEMDPSSMASMDEYWDQLLAEMETPEPLRGVVHNILDDPISQKKRRSAY